LKNTTHTFICYNYDLVLDSCIQETAGERWSPETGYGIRFSETIQTAEAMDHMKQFNGSGGGYALLEPHPARLATHDVSLLKPHGSLNWLVPFEGNYKFTEEEPLLLLDANGKIAYCDEFAVEQIRHTRNPSRIAFNAGLFITPPLDKDGAFPVPSFLASVQAESLSALGDADEIVVIGWSMPSTDKFEVSEISAAMSNAARGHQVTAVNFHADEAYFQKLANVFHVSESDITAFNAGFADFVAQI
jgi:hypothetical protein